MDTSPHHSDFVRVNGIRLHYLDWGGKGQVLLFLAGLGCNAHIYDRFAPRFTDKFHVLALTRRGHGESDYPERGYDIDTLTEDIRQFLDLLDIERVVLAGHSLAGVELSHFAALYSERVIKLVYLDAAYYRNSPEYKAMQEKNPMRNFEIPGEKDSYASAQELADHIQWAYPSLKAIWDDLMDEHHKHEVKVSPEGRVVYKMSEEISQAIAEMISSFVAEDAKIKAPVLSIYALKESRYYVSPDYMTEEMQGQMIEFFEKVQQPWNRHCIEQFQRNVPQAKIVLIPNGHHYCFIKHEELVFEEMKTFLSDNAVY